MTNTDENEEGRNTVNDTLEVRNLRKMTRDALCVTTKTEENSENIDNVMQATLEIKDDPTETSAPPSIYGEDQTEQSEEDVFITSVSCKGDNQKICQEIRSYNSYNNLALPDDTLNGGDR